MNILVLQGPNLNLIGKKSAYVGRRVTLDKINTALRRHVRNRDIALKIFQTHVNAKAITFLHRQRTWADGIVMAPMAWSHYDWSLKETFLILKIPLVQVFLSPEFLTVGNGTLFNEIAVTTIASDPMTAFCEAVDAMEKYLTESS
ncbi:MAG: type II 3-dehydroquinate dehydratase [Fidelibacterota bacterium]